MTPAQNVVMPITRGAQIGASVAGQPTELSTPIAGSGRVLAKETAPRCPVPVGQAASPKEPIDSVVITARWSSSPESL